MTTTIELDSSKQIARIIHQHRALGALPEKSRAQIVSTASLSRFKQRGDVVIPRGLFMIVGFGLMKTTITVEKADFIAGLAGPGESVGLFDSMKAITEVPNAVPNRLARHSVVTDSATIVFVRATAVLGELAAGTDNVAVLAFALACGWQESYMRERLITTTFGSSEARVATMLVDLVDHYGDQREDGTWFIPFHFTRAELAALCGVTQETLIRKLSAWSKDGLVTDASAEHGGGLNIRNLADLRKIGVYSR